MKTTTRMILMFAAAASAGAMAAENAPCQGGPEMRGMQERMSALHAQMDRIERIPDRAEQRRILDLHMKQMREGMRQIRSRDLPPAVVNLVRVALQGKPELLAVLEGDKGRDLGTMGRMFGEELPAGLVFA